MLPVWIAAASSAWRGHNECRRDARQMKITSWSAVVGQPDQLGESPFWHPEERASIGSTFPARQIRRLSPDAGDVESWAMPMEPGCIAPMRSGGLVIALRDGIYRRATGVASSARSPISAMTSPRPASTTARLIRWGASGPAPCTSQGRTQGRALLPRPARPGGKPLSNSRPTTPPSPTGWPGRPMRAPCTGPTRRPRDPCLGLGCPGQPDELSSRVPAIRGQARRLEAGEPGYGGRPDGAAVDVEGNYWVAMFEGERLLRFSPAGRAAAGVPAAGALPDHALLRRRRPAHPVRHQRQLRPLRGGAGGLAAIRLRDRTRVDVPGLPVNFVRTESNTIDCAASDAAAATIPHGSHPTR